MAERNKVKYISKGQRPNVSKSLIHALVKGRSYTDRLLTKHNAWLNGDDPWIVIPNVNTNETNKPFVKIRANTLWGDPKKNKFSMQAIKKDHDETKAIQQTGLPPLHNSKTEAGSKAAGV